MGQALAYTLDDLREFLLQTSVSESLDAELAEKLTGRSDSALLLERARVQPGFLESTVRESLALSLPPDVSCPAACRTHGHGLGEVRRLSALAAEWFASHGEYARAAPLAVQGQSRGCLLTPILAGLVRRPGDRRPELGATCSWRGCPLPTSKQT